jgi:hypothetical protein
VLEVSVSVRQSSSIITMLFFLREALLSLIIQSKKQESPYSTMHEKVAQKLKQSRFSKYSVEDVEQPYTNKPLTESFRRQATQYMNKKRSTCYLGVFDKLEYRVQDVMKENTELKYKGEYFDHTFAEYVLLEVRTKNRAKLIPRWNLPARFCYYSKLVFIRSDCRLRRKTKHATPRFHAKIYRKEINDELIQRGLYFTVPLYYMNGKTFARDNPFFVERREMDPAVRAEHHRRGQEMIRENIERQANAPNVVSDTSACQFIRFENGKFIYEYTLQGVNKIIEDEATLRASKLGNLLFPSPEEQKSR